jgi:hypothetical protein
MKVVITRWRENSDALSGLDGTAAPNGAIDNQLTIGSAFIPRDRHANARDRETKHEKSGDFDAPR